VTLRTPHRSRINGIVTSCVVHGVVIAAAVFLTTASESTRSHPSPAAYEPPSHIIWLSAPGLGGGGGGGGAKEQSPARAAEVKGPDKQTMPSASRAMSDTPEQPKPVDPLPDVPVQTLGASNLTSMGLIEAGAETLSLGAGDGGGAGTGRGTGMGPGAGPGVGPGRGGGIGDGVWTPGNGVTMPVPVHQEKPQYTIEAMRARIEGAVVVECVVQPNGVCARLRVLRSLDSRLGLDEQALRAASAWRFSPGTLLGKPVAVLVTIQLGFSIH
jgi:protein TonB